MNNELEHGCEGVLHHVNATVLMGCPTPMAASTILQAAAICLFDLVTIAGNALIILSIARVRELQSATSAFILNLALVDLLVGVTLMPMALVTSLNQKIWVLGEVVCMASGFINMLFPLASICTLSVIAIDRYCAIVKPLRYPALMTKRRVAFFLVWVWAQSFLVTSLPLTPWSRYSYNSNELLCLIDWKTSAVSFAIFCLGLCILLPLAIMSFCYYHILRVARRHSRQVQALKAISTNIANANRNSDLSISYTLSETGADSHTTQQHRGRYHAKRRALRAASAEHKSTAMMMMVMGVFVLAWLPYISGALCKSISSECGLPETYFTVSVLVAMLQSSLNPVIYGVMDRRFRKAMKSIVLCSSRRVRADSAVVRRRAFATTVV